MHIKYYQIGGVTLEINSDIPINQDTFQPKINLFEIPGKLNDDLVSFHHHFSVPSLSFLEDGRLRYSQAPWQVFDWNGKWVYCSVTPQFTITKPLEHLNSVSFFDQQYTNGEFYFLYPNKDQFLKGNFHSVTLSPTDQVFLAPILSLRQACYFHASGVIYNNQGLLFVGHSGAGKSTIVKMLMDEAEILCDDRVILRRGPDGFKIYGTWSHGEISIVSPNNARLNAVFILEKANENRLIPITDLSEKLSLALHFVIKSFLTTDWWSRIFDLLENMIREVPFYRLQFNKSGEVKDIFRQL